MISQRCPICQGSSIAEINRQIVEGGSLTSIAESFTLPYHVLYYHKQHHMPKSMNARATDDQQKILDEMTNRKEQLEDMLLKSNSPSVQLKIMQEIRATNQQWILITGNLAQARADELRMEELKHSTTDQQEDDQEAVERMKVFTTNELKMFIRLQQKYESQDQSCIIIPDDYPQRNRLTRGNRPDHRG